jgi:energy-coupling factor transporter ATP-binding protein EcfA2
VVPRRGGKLEDFLRFINVNSDEERLLLKAYIVAALVPDIPHPVLVVYGPQGATKTTLLRVLRRLIDPSQTETLTISTDLREFVQLLSHHWSPFFDNVSRMPDWISDAICRAATGDVFSKRELYSDDEDVICQFRRCVALNGINVAAHRPDLLDRSILIGLPSIPSSQRKEERKFWKEFEEMRPCLFGTMLTTLSQAMALLPSIKPASLPRMADFAVWGCAIAEVLGHSSDDFLDAFNANSEVRNEEALSSSPIASAIIQFLGNRDVWEGPPAVLLESLSKIVGERQSKSRDWPKAPHILTRRIREVIPNLALIGIDVEIGGRTRESRRITIRKGQPPNVTNVTTSRTPSPSRPEVPNNPDRCDAGDASDATFPPPTGERKRPLPPPLTQDFPKANCRHDEQAQQPPIPVVKTPVARRLAKLKKARAQATQATPAGKPAGETVAVWAHVAPRDEPALQTVAVRVSPHADESAKQNVVAWVSTSADEPVKEAKRQDGPSNKRRGKEGR